MRLRSSIVLAVLSSLAASVPAAAQATAADAVSRLYRDYAWETSDADDQGGREPLLSASPEVMRRYLDSALVAAVLADRACQERVEGVCNLDFAPMWASQDPGGVTVRVVPTRDSAVVRAELRYPYQNQTTVVTYHMRRTREGWRVADMGAASWPSLLRLLRQPVE